GGQKAISRSRQDSAGRASSKRGAPRKGGQRRKPGADSRFAEGPSSQRGGRDRGYRGRSQHDLLEPESGSSASQNRVQGAFIQDEKAPDRREGVTESRHGGRARRRVRAAQAGSLPRVPAGPSRHVTSIAGPAPGSRVQQIPAERPST